MRNSVITFQFITYMILWSYTMFGIPRNSIRNANRQEINNLKTSGSIGVVCMVGRVLLCEVRNRIKYYNKGQCFYKEEILISPNESVWLKWESIRNNKAE